MSYLLAEIFVVADAESRVNPSNPSLPSRQHWWHRNPLLRRKSLKIRKDHESKASAGRKQSHADSCRASKSSNKADNAELRPNGLSIIGPPDRLRPSLSKLYDRSWLGMRDRGRTHSVMGEVYLAFKGC
jgi:hypothetical protein